MKAYLVSDNHDSLVGMRLAGVEGCIVSTADEAEDALSAAANMKDLAILFVTEKAAAMSPIVMDRLRGRTEFPLVIEIPDRHGSLRDADYLTKYVQEAIGVKM